jgi:hypothetical protein
MSNVTQVASSIPDVTTFAANAVVFLAAVAAVVAGAWKAVQEVKKSVTATAKEDGTQQTKIASAVLMETTSMQMLTESNRDVEASNRHLCDCLISHGEKMIALAHQIERLRDRME